MVCGFGGNRINFVGDCDFIAGMDILSISDCECGSLSSLCNEATESFALFVK